MADGKSREVIGGKRKCGKTTELIKRSHETGVRILTANRHMARILMDQSRRMSLDIKPPLTSDVNFKYFEDVEEVLIDEVELVLQQLIGKRVVGMSTSYKLRELNSVKESKSVGSFHIDINCENALKGLKAVQREARKTTQSLKELEEQQNKSGLFKRDYRAQFVGTTLDNTLNDNEKERLFNLMAKHNLGTNQLVEIAEVSAEMQDRGINVHKVLSTLLAKHKRDGYLNVVE